MTTDEVGLAPMDSGALAAFLARPRDGWLAELVAQGMSPDEAATRVRSEQEAAFPAGRPAPGHTVYAVRRLGVKVGHVWLGPAPGGGARAWWVWEIEIEPAAQGRGVGRRAMELAEQEARAAGATSIGLSVAADNGRARGLYESLGFRPAATHLHKPLE